MDRRFDVNRVETNLRSVWNLKTKQEFETGRAWYSDANVYLNEIAKVFEVSIEKTCAIAAVLSPNNSWNSNVKDTYHLIKSKGKRVNSSTYKQNIRKAKLIFRTGKVSLVSGPKVSCFFDNLLYPKTSEQVTIDTHILRAAVNDVELSFKTGSIPGYMRVEIERVIRLIASENNILPLECQAILWGTWKRLSGSRNTEVNQKFFLFR